VGTVDVTGDPGMTVDEFRRHAHLKAARKWTTKPITAPGRVLKDYRREQRLEAEIKIESQQYAKENQKTNFRFSATRVRLSRCWWRAQASARYASAG